MAGGTRDAPTGNCTNKPFVGLEKEVVGLKKRHQNQIEKISGGMLKSVRQIFGASPTGKRDWKDITAISKFNR